MKFLPPSWIDIGELFAVLANYKSPILLDDEGDCRRFFVCIFGWSLFRIMSLNFIP